MRSQFKICFAPTQSTVCMHLLEEHVDNPDLWPRISFLEYKIGLIPYDTDVLSLELSYVFKQVRGYLIWNIRDRGFRFIAAVYINSAILMEIFLVWIPSRLHCTSFSKTLASFQTLNVKAAAPGKYCNDFYIKELRMLRLQTKTVLHRAKTLTSEVQLIHW